MSKKTLEQVEAMQAKAVRFATNVLQDSDKADELESLSPEEYADRKRVEIIDNPPLRNRYITMAQMTRAQLQERIKELEEENEELQDSLDDIANIASPESDDESEDDSDDSDEEDEDDLDDLDFSS